MQSTRTYSSELGWCCQDTSKTGDAVVYIEGLLEMRKKYTSLVENEFEMDKKFTQVFMFPLPEYASMSNMCAHLSHESCSPIFMYANPMRCILVFIFMLQAFNGAFEHFINENNRSFKPLFSAHSHVTPQLTSQRFVSFVFNLINTCDVHDASSACDHRSSHLSPGAHTHLATGRQSTFPCTLITRCARGSRGSQTKRWTTCWSTVCPENQKTTDHMVYLHHLSYMATCYTASHQLACLAKRAFTSLVSCFPTRLHIVLYRVYYRSSVVLPVLARERHV